MEKLAYSYYGNLTVAFLNTCKDRTSACSIALWHLVAFRLCSTTLRHVDQTPEMHKDLQCFSLKQCTRRTLTTVLQSPK